jgi:hypothetical protein
MWRRALSQRISEEADTYVDELGRLQKKYAMRMPTIADRIQERFVRPMTVDRMRALVRPAMEEVKNSEDHTSFELLEHVAESLAREPSGVGLDVPPWLEALEDEVDRALHPEVLCNGELLVASLLPPLDTSISDVKHQLDNVVDLVSRRKRRK